MISEVPNLPCIDKNKIEKKKQISNIITYCNTCVSPIVTQSIY